MSALNNSALMGASGSTGYQISRSVRLRSSASAYFNRTPASAGNQQKWTWSGWVKRGALGANQVLMSAGTNGSSTNLAFLQFNSSDSFQFYVDTGAANYSLVTTQVFRDPSAWYHLVIAFDSTQATASNRTLIYVNGSQITAFSTANYTPQNNTYGINSTLAHNIGRYVFDNTRHFDGYLTEINFIDGQALTPASFGETNAVTGVWQPKKYTGTYGTNGFYLNFSDNSSNTATTIGKDYSGNGNNWTPNNISVTAGVTYDSMLDVPTQWADGGNGRGNYATLNPLDKYSASSVTNGNLYTDGAGAAGTGTSKGANSTISVTSGKWYWEVTQNVGSGSYECRVGIWSGSSVTGSVEGTASSRYFYRNPGANLTRIYSGTSFTDYASYYGTFTDGDVLMFALDVDSGKMWLGKNGTWFNNAGGAKNPATGTNADWTTLPTDPIFVVASNYQTSSQNSTLNFGQRGFAYTPPSGFKALNTLNLPTPTILKGNQYFDVVTRSGTGSAASVSSLLFQPNAILTKLRNTAYNWYWADSERGVSKTLSTDTTAAEQTPSPALYTSFDSNGYTLGTSTGSNGLTYTYVDYLWKEGATQGFDIVLYTGNSTNRTIAHNLGVAPRMIILKSRTSGTAQWVVYHGSLSNTQALYLNATSSAATSALFWNSTSPTSSVFSLGTSSDVNVTAQDYVAYLFAEVAGFSRFGSYTGNGSTDGPFVFCGFRPRYVMVKRTDSADSWQVWDTARDPYNVTSANLYPNLANAEVTDSSQGIDIVSNGFKLRTSNVRLNASGGTYIFAAFCENPFKNALAR